jgi:hypothetical protein
MPQVERVDTLVAAGDGMCFDATGARHVRASRCVRHVAGRGGQSSSFRNAAGVRAACRRIEPRVPRLMVPCSGITTTRPSELR